MTKEDELEIENMPFANDGVKPHPHEREGSASSREVAEPDPSAASTILLGVAPSDGTFDLASLCFAPSAETKRDIETLMSVAEKLLTEFTRQPFIPSSRFHFCESCERTMGSDEFGEEFGRYIFNRLYMASGEHLAPTFELGMPGHKVIAEQIGKWDGSI